MGDVFTVDATTLQFEAGAACPLCGDDMDIHTTIHVVGMVEKDGSASAKVVACDRVKCAWFAGCTSGATHAEPHPVLEWVPACDRCPKIGS